MDISIIIVNYNTESHIDSLLSQLKLQTLDKERFEIVITNNVQNRALEDVLVKHSNDLNIKLICSPDNVGFGRANNLAALEATGDHLLITNPDVRMLQNDYLEKLLSHIELNPDYGVITTRVLDDNDKDTSEYYQYEFGRTLGYDDQICWFSGALLALRQTVFQELNGFDPDFFMYCEDEDLCFRIKKAGLSLLKINALSVHHIGGASEPSRGYDFFYRWHRSQLLFALKHFSDTEFQRLLMKLMRKSTLKHRQYSTLSALGFKNISSKINKYKAIQDVVERTIDESPSWLYFNL
jgi:GT2 family glycosyltransferase